MLQILNKDDFIRLCNREGFKPIRRISLRPQEITAPEIGRVESPIVNPLDILFTRQNWRNRGLI